MRLADIQIRDPFVLPVPEEQTYYLFGSTDPMVWAGPGIGFDCYRSRDLESWDGPITAFRPPDGFWSPGMYWAPEVHRVDGWWCMLATFTGADGHRGTQALRSSRPEGPYEPWSDGVLTPPGWQCLDGTLLDDDVGRWLVFCHEWTQCSDGTVCAVRLADDLSSTESDVLVLFSASEAPWSRALEGFEGSGLAAGPPPYFVTDGPFAHRTDDGELLLLWSSFGDDGYATGIARSSTGTLDGPWSHDPEPLWTTDGGHCMVFRTFAGRLHLALHTPNDTPNERATFVPLTEEGDALRLAG